MSPAQFCSFVLVLVGISTGIGCNKPPENTDDQSSDTASTSSDTADTASQTDEEATGDADTDIDAGPNADMDADTDTDSVGDIDTDSDADGDTDTDTPVDPDMDAGADASADSDADTDTGGAAGDVEHSSSGLVFTPPRGFYEEPFDVIITHPTATRVAYTLDASNPMASEDVMEADLPAAITIDPTDTNHRYLAPGVVLRAMPLNDAEPTPHRVTTHTYIFPNRVVALSLDGESPGGNWPEPRTVSRRSTGQSIDYGMDPDICESAEYADQILPALLSIPSVSLVMDLPDLFDEETGIYVNAREDGIEWERPGSLELIDPDEHPGFQANAGVRIRGGYSCSGENPKHAFRLFFREMYGADKLYFPLFGDEGASKFDKIDLRTSQNYSWSFEGDPKNAMNRDVFSRDMQRELGRPYTRSRYYHLYLNGYYWGLFQSQERSEARFAETYLGGDSDDYDTIKVDTNLGYTIEATDGTLDLWNEVWIRAEAGLADDASYYAMEGRDADGARDTTMRVLVDIDNLIDYMLVIFFTGNIDGPVSAFLDNARPNNFYAVASRTNPEQGFIFFAHDNEHSLLLEETRVGNGVAENRVSIAEDGQGNDPMLVESFDYFHPQWLHHRLTANPHYRERFAARAREILEDDGPLTPSKTIPLISERRSQIEAAIIAESARWGDAQTELPLNKNDHWTLVQDALANEYLPVRTDIVIDQLQAADLY